MAHKIDGQEEITLLFAGDFSVGRDAAKYMEGVNELLESCDIRMFQLEEPYTRELLPEAGPDKLLEVLEPVVGKVDLVTLSGNHFYDYGERGVADTLDWCREKGIACCGGGLNADQASKPAFVSSHGVKVGVLAWNCVGSKYTFARANRGGTNGLEFTRAWVDAGVNQSARDARVEWDVWSLKEPQDKQGMFEGYNFVSCEALEQMASDVRAAKEQCDILIVYFHKGYVHQPVVVDTWERMISHIAIDNGADAVMSSHSHISHGVEIYKGAPVFHGLNNFVMWVPQLSPDFKGEIPGGADSVNQEWIRARVKRFGFVPDPSYPTYPFHPESVHCHVAKLIIKKGPNGKPKIAQTRMVLMQTERSGVPYVHGQDEKGIETFNYMQCVTTEAGLNGKLFWDGNEVVVSG